MRNSVFTRRLTLVGIATIATAMVVAPEAHAQRKRTTPTATPEAPVNDSVPAADTSAVPLSAVPIDSAAVAREPMGKIFNPEPRPGTDTVNRVVAVVGKVAITWSELAAAVYNRVSSGSMQMPRTEADQMRAGRAVLEELINEELMVQKAPELKVEVSESDVTSAVDRQVKEVRSRYPNETEYRNALKSAGMGTPEQYRQMLFDQFRRTMVMQRVRAEMSKTSKPGSVTDAEVDTAFAQVKDEWSHVPASVTFRQIVIAPRPSAAEDSAARKKAENILAQLRKGADFETLAKQESMDPGTKDNGGDLGWSRRNGTFVAEFEAAMFNLRPGELSQPVKTAFGYHIIRVDRVQPALVKVRHILIAPKIDSTDVVRTRKLADSVATVWRAGGNFESLVNKFHDQAEVKTWLTPFPIDSLPAAYAPVFKSLEPNQVSAPFDLVSPSGAIKFAIVQLVTRTKEGEYPEAELRERIRQQLMQEKQIGIILDRLRKQTYVSNRF